MMKSLIKASSSLMFLLYSLSSIIGFSSAVDTINMNHILRDGDTIVSSVQRFELGFFSPGRSTNRYVGIWYKNVTAVRTPVWVANRELPLNNTTSGVLTLIPSGQLVIRDESNNNNTVWSSKITPSRVARNPVVQLLDSGNLVVREANDDWPENYLWQSFDYPTDTLLPGMDFGWNHATGKENYLSAWITTDDPAPGPDTLGFDLTGYPQLFIKRAGLPHFRLGPWNIIRLSATQDPIKLKGGSFRNNSVIYYRDEPTDESVFTRFTLAQLGVGQRFNWMNQSQTWAFSFTVPDGICDSYGICGAYGSCNANKSPICRCLDKFVPKDEQGWVTSDWTEGCVRRTPLNCPDDRFMGISGIKLPDSRVTWFNESLNLEECKAVCLRNCSCMAYSNMSGCLIWFGDLVDIRLLSGAPQKIYIRMAASELDSIGMKQKITIAVSTSLAGIVLLGLSVALFIWKKKKLRKCNDEDLELPIYDLSTVSKATNNFSNSNKLGEGGYGPVYKGILEDGKEIAIKRLSEFSSQGVDEFMNEVICIAKLQHRNLVKLLGCCIQGDEKMLIYEYLFNKSLDLIIFDKTNSTQLDWQKRFHIINGIARGLLYLHQDSHLRIIHRDLKASNILLDNDLHPKISDFGMARIFGGNVTEAKTKRVVGTYGYMSPEYAGDGLFSLKSDVYSFGVLLLEIMSGQRNRGFHHKDYHHNLLGHAWILYKEGRSLELLDPNIVISISLNELQRSMHVALLCVQHCTEDRPSMSSVVLMLGSACVLPEAGQPGFFSERPNFDNERTTNSNATSPSNEYTITLLESR